MKKSWIVPVVSLFMAACASDPAVRNDKTPEQTLKEIEASMSGGSTGAATATSANATPAAPAAAGAPPQAVADALLPGYTPSIPGAVSQAPGAERFDISVARIPARTFFMGLVKDTPINVVVHPDVSGFISLDLKGVTIDEVLEVARDVYGYEYQKNRAGYYILPARLQSRIYNVSYLNIARKGESNTRVTSGQFSTGGMDNNQSSGNNNNNSGNRNNNRGGGNRSGEVFPSSKVETKSEADFWNDLQVTVSTLIGGGEGRSVVVNPQSGLVVVRAMPGELRDVENFLQSAQTNLHRQVIIEAKVLEVQLNDQHQAGINWAALHNGSGSRRVVGGQFEIIDGQSEIVDSAGNLLTSGIVGTKALPGYGGIFTIGAASDDFALIIRLLDQQGNVNVLSSPRVSTVNNQKAVIKVGSDEFFVTEISSTTNTSVSTSTTTPQIILTPFFSGIALDVTPQINDKDEVILHIHPTISEVVDQVKDITVAGQDQSLPLAFSTVRESDSIVRALNGQVIIIGGLMQDQKNEIEGGIPVLSKIPFLGRLFKQTQRSQKRSELVILLKPIVIGEGDDNVWETELSRITERMDDLK
jgi:MSHA biogenesis protein MshL